VENLRRSDVFESGILAEALELYKLKHPKGHSFTYLHCWYLLRNVPRWVEGSVIECRKSLRVPAQVRGCREIPHSIEPKSECAFHDPLIIQEVVKQRLRLQGNMVAKEEYKNQKLRDASIRAQFVATKELVEASKSKANILTDQNILMLFIAPDNGNMSEDSRKYLHLRRQIELKKLPRMLVEEEEVEYREAIWVERGRVTNGEIIAHPADVVDAANHGDQPNKAHEDQNAKQGNDDEEGNRGNDELTQSELRSSDLWNSKVDANNDVDIEDQSVDLNASTGLADLQHRRPLQDLESALACGRGLQTTRPGARRGHANPEDTLAEVDKFVDVEACTGPMAVGNIPRRCRP
jgi:hypothetical protein